MNIAGKTWMRIRDTPYFRPSTDQSVSSNNASNIIPAIPWSARKIGASVGAADSAEPLVCHQPLPSNPSSPRTVAVKTTSTQSAADRLAAYRAEEAQLQTRLDQLLAEVSQIYPRLQEIRQQVGQLQVDPDADK